jgi:hypothetical protein
MQEDLGSKIQNQSQKGFCFQTKNLFQVASLSCKEKGTSFQKVNYLNCFVSKTAVQSEIVFQTGFRTCFTKFWCMEVSSTGI